MPISIGSTISRRRPPAFPHDEFSILLSHTPEIYRQAAHAGFDLLLAGHTHGGQICLPGCIPITLDSNLPRRMGAGAWDYDAMAGYTSVGAGSSVVPCASTARPRSRCTVCAASDPNRHHQLVQRRDARIGLAAPRLCHNGYPGDLSPRSEGARSGQLDTDRQGRDRRGDEKGLLIWS